jgi:photosystem II stability/assembly factor-like uncharacterized protein
MMLRAICGSTETNSGTSSGLGRNAGPAFFLAWLFALAAVMPVAAQEWKRLGPPGGMVVSLAAAPVGTVYLGTPDGHVFASTDRGEHWELRGRAGGRLDGVVQHLVVDERQPGRVLAAVWFRNAEGGGVFASEDGARHWKAVGLTGEAVRTLEHSVSEPKIWIAGARSGVFRSSDDGQTWQRITPADDVELQNVDSLAIDPRDAQTIYVGTYHLPWKSTDGGKNWNSIAAGMIDDSDIMSLRIDVKNPQRIFSSACSGIYRSEDGGANWTKLQGIPYSSRRTQQIVQDPTEPGSLYAATTEGLWATFDSGETWKRITSRVTDASSVAVLAGPQGKRLLAGFDAQGVLRSDDGGATFVPANTGFLHRVILAMAEDPRDARHLLAHVEGFPETLLESADFGASWTEIPGPPSGGTIDRIFGSSTGWWASFSGGGTARFEAAAQKWTGVLFREVVTFRTRATTGAPAQTRRRIRAVTPHVAGLVEIGGEVIAGTDEGLWKSGGSAASFARMPAKNLPKRFSYIAVGPDSSLWAIGDNQIWNSRDGGDSWTREDFSQGDASLLWITKLPGAQLLVGTQRGVFLGEGDAQWQLVANGLPGLGSKPPLFVAGRWLIAMANGGYYASSDDLKSWSRLDTDAEQGSALGVFGPIGDLAVVASESEGVMQVRIESRKK